jgi:hypothetical protein
MNKEDLELFEGSRELMNPQFETLDEEEAFRHGFHAEMEPALQEIARQHAEAERASMTHLVG